MAAVDEIEIAGELRVRRIGFGTVRLTGPRVWGPPTDVAAAQRVLRRAVDAGVGLIDTADCYGPHVVEELIAQTLRPYPNGLVITTKGGTAPTGPGDWTADGRPTTLKAACEGSLRRLRLERIDLYQLHRVDPAVPIEESVGALRELRAEGKIGHIGLSNVTCDELVRAESVAPIATVQNRYSVADRASDDVLLECEQRGIPFMPWFPLGRGVLARSKTALDAVGARVGGTAAQVALAWLLQRSPVVLAIPGTSRVDHLEENLAAGALQLDTADLDALDAVPGGIEVPH